MFRACGFGHEDQVDSLFRQALLETSVGLAEQPARPVTFNGAPDFASGDESRGSPEFLLANEEQDTVTAVPGSGVLVNLSVFETAAYAFTRAQTVSTTRDRGRRPGTGFTRRDAFFPLRAAGSIPCGLRDGSCGPGIREPSSGVCYGAEMFSSFVESFL